MKTSTILIPIFSIGLGLSMTFDALGSGLPLQPHIQVMTDSKEGVTSDENVRCLVFSKSEEEVVVEIMTKKEFLELGLGVTLVDKDGTLIAETLLKELEIPSEKWIAYRLTLRKDAMKNTSFTFYQKGKTNNLYLKEVPIQPETMAEHYGYAFPPKGPHKN